MSMMTSEEYRIAIARLGLSQVQAGHFFGATPRTSRRWAREGVPSLEKIRCIRLLARLDLSADELADVRGLDFLGLLARFGIDAQRAEAMTQTAIDSDGTP